MELGLSFALILSFEFCTGIHLELGLIVGCTLLFPAGNRCVLPAKLHICFLKPCASPRWTDAWERLRQHPSKRGKRKPNKNHTKNHRFKITRFRRVKVGCCLFLQWQQQIVIICALPAVPWPPAQLRLLHLERAHRGQAMQLRVHPKAPCRARPARPTATQDGGQRSCGSRPSTPNAFPLPRSAAVGRRRGHSATSG